MTVGDNPRDDGGDARQKSPGRSSSPSSNLFLGLGFSRIRVRVDYYSSSPRYLCGLRLGFEILFKTMTLSYFFSSPDLGLGFDEPSV